MSMIVFAPAEMLRAQSSASDSAPAGNPAAAVGMTSGLDDRVRGRDAELMQVRAAAREARGEAAQASVARSADRTLEEQQRRRMLEDARERKALKREIANRMKWRRAADAYQKVSADEMSSWRTERGNVRVERNVPDSFLLALIEEEERRAAEQEAAEEEEGFAPLEATRNVLSWRPWERSETAAAEVSASDDEGGGGVGSVISRLNPVRLISGGGDDDSAPAAAASGSDAASAEPRFAGSASAGNSRNRAAASRATRGGGSAPGRTSTRSPSGAGATSPGSVPRISGAALVDGNSPVNQEEEESPQPTSAERTPERSSRSQSRREPASFADSQRQEMPGREREGSGGFFSFLTSRGGGDSSDGGGGLFGFGKKKKEARQSAGNIDASLFPSESTATAARASSGGGYDAPSRETAPPPAPEPAPSGGSGDGLDLPNRTAGSASAEESSDSGFSFPGFGGSDDADDGGGGSAPSTLESSGTGYYVVESSAQFMEYGADRMQSEVRALPAGTVVRMTRPGDQWAGVRLSGGAEGVIQNEDLRAASSSEIGGQFAAGQ